MRSCCRGSACTGRACVAGRWGPGLLRRARCVRSANGRLWCWGHRIGHGAFRIRPARRRDRRTAGPLPARGRVRGDALSTCMDCGLVSGACLWLSCIRRTASRRRPGVGNRRWSIPCTSIPHIGKKCPACLGYVSREGPPAGHPRFMGYRHNGCRRHGRRPSMRRLQGLLVAPCRTEMIIATAAEYEEWSNHFWLNHFILQTYDSIAFQR